MSRFAPLALTLTLLALPACETTLTILHTNDMHSRIEPINKYNSGCAPEQNDAGKCFGGSARLLTAIGAAREMAPDAILVDGGDQFQGSLFYTYYKGKAAAEMMNALGYDAMTVGNHEFDDGPEVLRGFMDAVSFPVLLANADVSAEPYLAGALMPSAIIDRDGEKIGLIGLSPENTADVASPGDNILFHGPIEAARREVARLEAAGVDRIIVLSHSGYNVDQAVAAAVDGIDVIVGGHTNTLLSNTDPDASGPYPTWVTTPNGGRTAIVQAYAYGKYLGRLDVSFDANGVVTEAMGEPVLVDASFAEDAKLKARIATLAAPLNAVRDRVVGETTAPIDGEGARCRAGECEMGNFVADALLARVRSQGIGIAFVNGGGLRSSIDAGPITMGEVLSVVPFQNTIATFRLTGADLIAALEHGVTGVENGDGRFPQVAGLRFTFTTSVPPGQGRIKRAEVKTATGWRPIDPKATYGLVSNDFMRRGGDGYAVFAKNAIDAYDFGPNLEDVLAEYLTAAGPYIPVTDGRIRQQ